MQLEMQTVKVHDVVWGDRTLLDNGILRINPEEFRKVIDAETELCSALEIVKPGENARIVNILDVVEPRVKVNGPPLYPGCLAPPHTTGIGITRRLSGVVLMGAGHFKGFDDPNLSQKEAIVDMVGPVKNATPFSSTINIVIQFNIPEEYVISEMDRLIRRSTLRASIYLAQASINQEPDYSTIYSLNSFDSSLPNLGLILQLASKSPHGPNGTGILFDTLLYGRTVDGIFPTIIHANELMDGAVVSDDYHYGGYRNPTYVFQNNPIVDLLYKGHGKAFNFKGVVLTRGYYHTLLDKERAANYAANLAQLLAFDGAVITTQGGGNTHIDAMLTVQACENRNIKTALIVSEVASDVGDVGFVDYVNEADLIISAGNIDEWADFPEVERVVGGEKILLRNLSAKGPFRTYSRDILLANSQVGAAKLTTLSY